MGDKKILGFVGAGLLFVAFLLMISFVRATVTGGAVTPGTPERAPNDTAGNAVAYAGNVTFLDIYGFTTTQAWQGYFGNVSGVIQLADANDNVFYNWTLAEPSGEVYASTNSTVNWPTIQCFNFTANGTDGGVDGETPGDTSLGGINLTTLEARFGILTDDVDGIDETFSFTPGGDGHDLFYTNNLQFSAGECLSMKSYNSAGTQGANEFEEVLMYEPSTYSVVFASILEEGTLNGFNSQDNDFQMMVPENGHGTDTSATTYYFFVELE